MLCSTRRGARRRCGDHRRLRRGSGRGGREAEATALGPARPRTGAGGGGAGRGCRDVETPALGTARSWADAGRGGEGCGGREAETTAHGLARPRAGTGRGGGGGAGHREVLPLRQRAAAPSRRRLSKRWEQRSEARGRRLGRRRGAVEAGGEVGAGATAPPPGAAHRKPGDDRCRVVGAGDALALARHRQQHPPYY